MENSPHRPLIAGLIEAGRFFFSRGWVPATSSNFSARLDDREALLTLSGRHKGALGEDDFLRVAIADGQSLEVGRRPSAETGLHTLMYRHRPEIGAVLHTHSVHGTVLSRLAPAEGLFLDDYELHKAFEGIATHETRLHVPVFDNDQDIARLAAQVARWLEATPGAVGYLIRGHGLYTWGRTIEDARRHVEAFEFLFECETLLWRRS